jgi:hypothetical protein
VQFNVDAQIVGIELEFVARANASVFIDIDGQCGNRRFKLQANVLVVVDCRLVINEGVCGHVHFQN